MSSLPLDRLAFLGTSFRRVGFDRLGDLVIHPEQERELHALAERLDAEELVYLATCNRVECYALTRTVREPAELEARLVEFFTRRGGSLDTAELRVARGAAAAQHLFATVSSLDSLVVGETEIAGQARRALQRSLDAGLAGSGLRELFERACTCNRRVRGSTRVGALSVSVGTLAVQKIKKYFGARGPQVSVVVGVGPMSLKVARALEGWDGERIFVNRTRRRAEELGRRFGGRALSLDEFLGAPPRRIDLLFSATSAPAPVITRGALKVAVGASRPRQPLVVCDLGVPPDVDPGLRAAPGVRMVTMADMETLVRQNHGQLADEITRARELIAREVGLLEREARFRGLASTGAQALLRANLSHLSPEDQELLLRFSQGLASRLARQPRVLEREVA